MYWQGAPCQSLLKVTESPIKNVKPPPNNTFVLILVNFVDYLLQYLSLRQPFPSGSPSRIFQRYVHIVYIELCLQTKPDA